QTILVYVKDPKRYYFDNAEVDREPYMAPGLVSPQKAARGKLPTDVWWHTIVSTTGKEKTGYPTQKPEGIVRRMVQASTRPGDWVLDFFAGSGTLGAVAAKLRRRYVLVDANPGAVDTMRSRLQPLARQPDSPELVELGETGTTGGAGTPRYDTVKRGACHTKASTPTDCWNTPSSSPTTRWITCPRASWA